MKKLFFLLLLCPAAAAAFDRSELAELNDLYKSERYEEAYEGYARMAAQEPGNPAGWYNAGNALFRMNRLGEAVHAYAKAFSLAPRDADIRFNLEFAMKQTGQLLLPDGVPRALHFLYYLLADGELRAGLVAFFWLGCLLGAAGFLLENSPAGGKFTAAAIAAAVLCLFTLAWLGARQTSPFTNAAVVTRQGGTKLLSGPGENFKDYASAPEGQMVKILDEVDEAYYEIGLTREGIKGWALKTEVRKI